MKKKASILVIVFIIIGLLLFFLLREKEKVYTIKTRAVDQYSTDIEIIVYANDKEFNDYKYIRYNDDNKTVICNSKNAVINKFELKDEKNVIIVLKDGEEKIAEVVK